MTRFVPVIALFAALFAGCAEDELKERATPPLRVSISDAGKGEMWGSISVFWLGSAIRCELGASSDDPATGFGLHLGHECRLLEALLAGDAVTNDQQLFGYTLADGREVLRPFERITLSGELEHDATLTLELGAPLEHADSPSLEGIAQSATATVSGRFALHCRGGIDWCDEYRRRRFLARD